MKDEPQPGPGAPHAWGPLKILRHLASGDSSEVYRARDTVLDRDVALKLFRTRDESEQQRLLDTGRTLIRVRHPNILQVLGANRHDGQVGYWMELVEGPTLGDILEESGPMSAADALRTGRHLCAALATLHNAGLLHRDINLENVIRVKDSGLRLVGFGPGIDRAGTAPELLEGKPPSPQSDIYALGAMLQRLASDASTAGDDVIARQFLECIETATARDPKHRFRAAEEFGRALTQAGKRPPSRLRRILGIGSILLLAVLVIMQWPTQYRFENTLYQIGDDNTRTEFVKGAAARSGDRLVLEVTTTVPMYVYVFGEDRNGNAWGLFPLANGGHGNPLRADETHTLPAKDKDAAVWISGDVRSLVRIHVLALPEEVPAFRLLYDELPALGKTEESDTAAAPLARAAGTLDEESDFAIGVTYRVIEIGNPAN